jgi:hypothetical protein
MELEGLRPASSPTRRGSGACDDVVGPSARIGVE